MTSPTPSEMERESVEEVLERLFNGADITDYGRDEVLEALARRSPSRKAALEEAARVARSVQFTDSRGMQAGLKIAAAIRALSTEEK